MKSTSGTMTPEEKLELTRERNRIKQASLRQRRAARMAELEATNAQLASLAGTQPLPVPKKGVRQPKRNAQDDTPSPSPSNDKPPAQPVASGSGTSGDRGGGGPIPLWAAERADDRPTKSDEEVARLTGVVSRLVSRLKEYGAGEGEIGRLIAGRDTSSHNGAGPGRSPLARLGTSNLAGSSYIQLTSPTSNERTSFQLPPLQGGDALPVNDQSNGSADSFPFAFLFNDSNPGPSSPYSPSPLNGTSFSSNHAVSTNNGVSNYGTLLLPSLPASTPTFAPPTKRSRHDQPPPPPLSSAVPTSESVLGPVPDDPEVMLARLGEIAATTGGKGDGTSENPLNKAIPWEWKEKLLDMHASCASGFESGSSTVHAESLMTSAQLLILRLLTATSSQKRLYDDERQLSIEDATYLASDLMDQRLRYLPDPLARVALGTAASDGRIDLTEYLARLISQATLYGDVWDWTGYALPESFYSLYPLARPAPSSPAGPMSLAPRLLPVGLRGASMREIILGLDPPNSRSSGPFLPADAPFSETPAAT